MLRIRTLGAGLIAIAAAIGSASAADIYAPPPPDVVYNPAPAYSWNGAYAGGIVGYGWGTAKNAGTSWDANGLTGGVFAGYNFQANPNFVLGVEGDLTASGMSGKFAGTKVTNSWDGTIRGRAGVTFDRFMLYGTGGLAVGSVKVTSGGKSDSTVRAGWTIGGGLEAAVTSNVTARLEYRYTDLGKDSFTTVPGKVAFTSSQVLAGVAVKF